MVFLEGDVTVPVYYLALMGGLMGTMFVAIAATYYRSRRTYETFELDLPPSGYSDIKADKKVNW